jgi:hypothetical protein
MAKFHCRVCGFEQPGDMWTPASSHTICPCCSTEFGLQDRNLESVHYRRMQWLTYGAEWFKEEKRPSNWSVEELSKQLKNIPSEWW